MTDHCFAHRLKHDKAFKSKTVNYKNSSIIDRLISRKEALACHGLGYDHNIEVCINVSVVHAVVRLYNKNLLIVGKNELI